MTPTLRRCSSVLILLTAVDALASEPDVAPLFQQCLVVASGQIKPRTGGLPDTTQFLTERTKFEAKLRQYKAEIDALSEDSETLVALAAVLDDLAAAVTSKSGAAKVKAAAAKISQLADLDPSTRAVVGVPDVLSDAKSTVMNMAAAHAKWVGGGKNPKLDPSPVKALAADATKNVAELEVDIKKRRLIAAEVDALLSAIPASEANGVRPETRIAILSTQTNHWGTLLTDATNFTNAWDALYKGRPPSSAELESLPWAGGVAASIDCKEAIAREISRFPSKLFASSSPIGQPAVTGKTEFKKLTKSVRDVASTTDRLPWLQLYHDLYGPGGASNPALASFWQLPALSRGLCPAGIHTAETRPGTPQKVPRIVDLCVDVDNGATVTGITGLVSTHVLPHQYIAVHLRGRSGDDLNVTLDGKTGVFKPGIAPLNETSGSTQEAARAGTGTEPLSRPEERVILFSPLLPGEAKLTFQRPAEGWSQAHTTVVESGNSCGDSAGHVQELTQLVDKLAKTHTLTRDAPAWAPSAPAKTPAPAAPAPATPSTPQPTAAAPSPPASAGGTFGTPQATPPAAKRTAEECAARFRDLRRWISDADSRDVGNFTFHVDRSYIGALRFGVAAPFATAANQSLSFSPVPNQTGASYLNDESIDMDVELVLGYTQFFNRRPASSTSLRAAWQVSMGLASLDLNGQAGLTVFRSLYTGPELGWDGFAVSPSLAIRKVDRLQSGFSDGMIVNTETATDYTRAAFGVGFGLVIFVTPELVKAGL